MPLPTGYLGGGVVTPQTVRGSRGGIPNATNADLAVTLAQIVKATFMDAAAIVTNGVSVSHAGAAVAGTTNQTIVGGVVTFVVPRNVVITVTHASSVVAMSGVITGTDRYGRVITEAWSVTATGTSKTNTGKKAFKTITSITEVIAADASTNTIISGNGKVLGLPFKAASVNLIAETQDGAIPTAGVIVAASSVSTEEFLGTYTPNATLNGALDFAVWYLVEDFTVQP